MDPETTPIPETTVAEGAIPPPASAPKPRAKKEETPSIGRMVHYVLQDGCNAGEHRPAIIVRVWPDTVNLQVFHDGDGTPHLNDGLINNLWKLSVPYSAEPKVGTWHWPERE